MTDPWAERWVHTVQVRRARGDNGVGVTFDEWVPVTGYYSDGTTYSSDGQIRSTGRFAFGIDVPYVPVESQITLPARFGGRTVTVEASAVGDGGGLPTPDHQIVEVK